MGLPTTLEGANYSFQLGEDFWTCIGLRRLLNHDIIPRYAAPQSAAVNFAVLASSLALRDRLPWQVLVSKKI
jgi:hypothetical protein